jgi:6-phosphogluconolactonase
MDLMKRMVALLLLALLALPAAASARRQSRKENGDSFWVYVGTYTGPESKGIYSYRFHAGTGRAVARGLAAETSNPSFLAASSNQKFLYAVNEVSDYGGARSGAVTSFAIDRKTGSLRFLNQVSSRGAGPCYVSLDRSGHFVLIANYDGGSVAAIPVLRDGRLGQSSAFVQHSGHSVNPQRQEGPHAHCIEVDRNDRHAVVADLGLDRLLVYQFDSQTGAFSPRQPAFAAVKPGSGPRHMAFDPSGRYLYLISEMASTITVFSYDARRGALRPLQTISSLPGSFKGQSYGAEIAVDASGKFLYASNRGDDTIAVFSIHPGRHPLTPVEYVPTRGKFPRSFAIAPGGAYMFVANQKSDNVVIFRIDQRTGGLTPTGQSLAVSSPVCVQFISAE